MQDSLGPAAERECHPGDIVGERGRHSMWPIRSAGSTKNGGTLCCSAVVAGSSDLLTAAGVCSDLELGHRLTQTVGQFVEMLRRARSGIGGRRVFFSHLGNLLDALGNLLYRRILLAHRVRDSAH